MNQPFGSNFTMKYIPWRAYKPTRLDPHGDEYNVPIKEKDKFVVTCKWTFTTSEGKKTFHGISAAHDSTVAPSIDEQTDALIALVNECLDMLSNQVATNRGGPAHLKGY